MSIFLFLLYLVITNLMPAELLPELVTYRIPFWLGIAALGATVVTLLPAGKLTIGDLPIGLLFGLILSMMLSLMWSDRWLGAPVYVLEAFGPALTGFLLAIWNITSLHRLRMTAFVLVILALILATQSVAAYHFGFMQDKLLLRGGQSEGSGEESATDTDVVRVRGLGQMNDPNDLALVLVTTLPFLGLAWQKRRTARNLVLLGPPGVLIIYATFLTRSRGGMLAIFAVFAAGLVSASRSKALLATATLAVIFMAVNFTGGRALSSTEESAAGRIDAWSAGLEMYRSNPVLGVGFLNFSNHHDLTAHNSFVLCFAELGTVGYFFWLALLVVAVLQLQQVRKCVDDSLVGNRCRRHAQALLASFAGTVVAASFLSRSYNPILYLFVGIAFALYRVARNVGQPVVLPPFSYISKRVFALEFISIIGIYIFVRANRLFGF